MQQLPEDICNIEDYVKSITGMESNSDSPSDNWFIEFEDNIVKDDTIIKHGFIKFFLL